MILLIDNYDSFTYNLAQYLGQLGEKLEVRRNDQITLDEIAAKKPERIVISPGPGVPQEAGIMRRRHPPLRRQKCRCWASAWAIRPSATPSAASVIRAPALMHGKTSRIHHDNKTIFHRPAAGLRGHALPLADRGKENPARASWKSPPKRRRPHHGPAPPQAAHRRRAVPPRIGAHRSRHANAPQFPLAVV